MNEADRKAHPWPLTGWIDFRWRRAVWAEVAPMYNQAGEDWQLIDMIRLILMRGIYPFLTWNFGTVFGREFKGYIGWKPISPKNDPAFYWRNLAFARQMIDEGALFVQLSVRGASAALVAVLFVLTPLAYLLLT